MLDAFGAVESRFFAAVQAVEPRGAQCVGNAFARMYEQHVEAGSLRQFLPVEEEVQRSTADRPGRPKVHSDDRRMLPAGAFERRVELGDGRSVDVARDGDGCL